MNRFKGLAWLPLLWSLISLACSLVIPSPQPTGTQPPVSTSIPPTPGITLEGKIAYASERGGTWQVIAMNADGSEETSLTSAFGAYSRPAWSPDGQKIGMRIDIGTGSGIAVMDVRQEGGKLAGSQPIAITSTFADGPRWSPDGNKLVYSSAEEGRGWQTFIADLGAGSSQQLSSVPENSIDPDWSPDGSRIVFSYYTDPSRQIRDLFVINADGTGLVQLTTTPAVNESLPTWSPDGTRIAFAAAEDSVTESPRQDIFIMNSDGSNLVRLTHDPAGDFDPAWSPDGKQLAFVSERNANNDSNYEIYLINADGTGEMRLTNNRYTDRWPSWRAKQPQDTPPAACQPGMSVVGDVTIPLGTRFANPQAFTKVWRVQNSGTCTWTPTSYSLRFVEGEQMGSSPQVMVPGAIQPGAEVDLILPLVSPDAPGSHSGKWQLFDGAGIPVPGTDGNPAALTVSIEVLPGDTALLPQPLYFLSGQGGSTQLWRMETDGRTQAQITNETGPVISFDVSRDGRIAYISQNQVILTDRSGQNRQVVADLGTEFRPNLAWSADGSRLAYALGGIRVHDVSTGQDRLVVADNQTRLPGGFVYDPFEWSPDGNKILARVYLWEGAVHRVISAADGTILAELPLEDSAWSTDSQSVYYAASETIGMMGSEPGLWQATFSGVPQPLVSNANAWWPAQSPDGSLLFFMHPPALAVQPDFQVFAYRAEAPSTEPQILNSQPVFLSLNDTFNVRWTKSAAYYVAQIVRPALGVKEVLLSSPDGTPPLFLMQEIGQFRWGP